jgi:hypothetical protein
VKFGKNTFRRNVSPPYLRSKNKPSKEPSISRRRNVGGLVTQNSSGTALRTSNPTCDDYEFLNPKDLEVIGCGLVKDAITFDSRA